jgi:hypothetical protein
MRVAAAVMVAGMLAAPEAAWAQPAETRFLLSLSGAFEPGSESFTDDGTFTLYDEAGRLSVASEVSTGAIIDLGVGMVVRAPFTLGLGVHRGASADTVSVSGQAPHPIFFNRPRSFSLEIDDVKRIEQAVHFSAGVLLPINEKFDVHIYGGPSQFRFSQQVVSSVTITEASGAFTAVNVTPAIEARKKNTWGGHIAADFSYAVVELDNAVFRLGAFLRYAQASSEFQVVNNTVSTKVGGMQYGAGLRVRF